MVAAKRNGSHVVLSGARSGCRFDGAGTNAQIYERFFRSQPHAATTSGSGLGLWIAQAFVGANGGKIEAVSAGVDRGTTVAIHLPLATDAPEVGADE